MNQNEKKFTCGEIQTIANDKINQVHNENVVTREWIEAEFEKLVKKLAKIKIDKDKLIKAATTAHTARNNAHMSYQPENYVNPNPFSWQGSIHFSKIIVSNPIDELVQKHKKLTQKHRTQSQSKINKINRRASELKREIMLGSSSKALELIEKFASEEF
jgi:benzoyl-CoA reductase/2-hydroxyglutaryl-CoA dehydratase subunit BcrC/BadD/HgdB